MIIIKKPDLLRIEPNATNITFKKPVVCELDKDDDKTIVRCPE